MTAVKKFRKQPRQSPAFQVLRRLVCICVPKKIRTGKETGEPKRGVLTGARWTRQKNCGPARTKTGYASFRF